MRALSVSFTGARIGVALRRERRVRLAQKKQRIAVGKPHVDPLAARNRTRFLTTVSSFMTPKSNPSGNWAKPKRYFQNGKESKAATPATRLGVALEANGLLVLHTARHA
jgi:hypothetical protein